MSVTTAIILAAGRGARMGSETSSQPKCLTKLAGKTILEWQIEALRIAGIEKVVLVGGYSIGHLSSFGDHLLENSNWENTNMVASLECACALLQRETCIVAYSDIVYHPEIIRNLRKSAEHIVIMYDRIWKSLWQLRFDDPLSDAETFCVHKDRLINIGQRTDDIDKIKGQYMGVFRISPEGWAVILKLLNSLPEKVRRNIDMTALLQRLVERNVMIACLHTDGRWCEVDTKKDRELYVKHLNDRLHTWSHDWRW